MIDCGSTGLYDVPIPEWWTDRGQGVLGVVGLFLAFGVLAAVGIYKGVDQTGVRQGVISRNGFAFYRIGLFVFGAVGGKIADVVANRWAAYLSCLGRRLDSNSHA